MGAEPAFVAFSCLGSGWGIFFSLLVKSYRLSESLFKLLQIEMDVLESFVKNNQCLSIPFGAVWGIYKQQLGHVSFLQAQ